MNCIYKITRSDNLEYIGITNNLKIRLNSHKKSLRFQQGIKKVEILFEGCYEDCQDGEEIYISIFDTYKNGLNVTPHGKGNHYDSSKFNTFGFKFSKSSREKMRKAKEDYVPWNKGLKGSFTPSEQWIKNHTFNGSENGRAVLNERIVRSLIKHYLSKPFIENVGIIQKNGIAMSYDWAYCNEYAKKYNITPQAIKRIIQKKTWKNVWKEFE